MFRKRQIQPESYAGKLWVSTGRSIEELEEVMCAVVQETFIKELRPTNEQIYTWRACGRGKALLQEHILEKTGSMVTADTLEVLWRYYTGRITKIRNRKRRMRIFESVDKHVCEYCESNVGPFHIDHRVPLALGGKDSEDNLQVLCETCNKKKGMRVDLKRPFIKMYKI